MLFLLAPIAAEYLLAYDSNAGNVAMLLGGLLVIAPLYGAPALLIREVARRRELGWPGILCLAAAWGIVEAGVIDQSMFNPAYRDIDYWPYLFEPTFLPGPGLSAFAAVSFVAGHAIFSLGAPRLKMACPATKDTAANALSPGPGRNVGSKRYGQ